MKRLSNEFVAAEEEKEDSEEIEGRKIKKNKKKKEEEEEDEYVYDEPGLPDDPEGKFVDIDLDDVTTKISDKVSSASGNVQTGVNVSPD